MAIFSIAFVLFAVGYPFHSARTRPMQAKSESSADAMVVSLCAKPGPDIRRIGGGKFGLHFDVPRREVKILGGKWDVDYVRFVIKPKIGDGFMELWFGPYAFNQDPEEELLANSVSSNKRNIVGADGESMGTDSFGRLQNREIWRHTFVATRGMEGARYKTGPENRALFDRIINSACYIPYPNR